MTDTFHQCRKKLMINIKLQKPFASRFVVLINVISGKICNQNVTFVTKNVTFVTKNVTFVTKNVTFVTFVTKNVTFVTFVTFVTKNVTFVTKI